MTIQPSITKKSYDSGLADQPLLGETIGESFDRIANTYPDRDALICLHQNIRLTYRELHRIVDRAAKAFLRLGITRGDRVAIWSTNNYEWVVTQYATAKIGAVLVTINPAYRIHEFEFVLRSSKAKAIILPESFKSSNYLKMFYQAVPEAEYAQPGQLESWRYPELCDVIFIGNKPHPGAFTENSFVHLADDYPESHLDDRLTELDIDDPVTLQYTSGTTGFPKGVLLTHNNILNNAFFIGEYMQFTENDRLCVPVPFFHCFGMIVGNLAAMTHASAVIIPAEVFDPESTLKAISQEKCTALHAVPAMFTAMLQHPDFNEYDLSTLRTGVTGAAPCPLVVMKQVVTKMHMSEVVTAYGQTEAAPITTMTKPDAPIERRVDSVGQVAPHQEIKIVETQSGHILPRGEPGEICFRGYNVMVGYDDDLIATAQTIDDHGWLHSGDLGTMDEEGYIRITGRIKEMVIRGGENIYPREIEEFLHTLPEISEVAVIGIPDEQLGEELLACIIPVKSNEIPSDEEMKNRCRDQIAHYKIPKYWLFFEQFPMTASGKIQKFKLRDQALRKMKQNKNTSDSPMREAMNQPMEE